MTTKIPHSFYLQINTGRIILNDTATEKILIRDVTRNCMKYSFILHTSYTSYSPKNTSQLFAAFYLRKLHITLIKFIIPRDLIQIKKNFQ